MTDVLDPPIGGPSGPPAWAPPAATVTAPAPTTAKRSWRPTSLELVDVLGVGGLTTLGLLGFGPAYGGTRYFVAGVVGLVLGLVVGHVTARTRQPVVVVAALGVLVFFVFGGATAVPDEAIGGVLPSPGAVLALVDGAVQGWAKLLTTVPPVGPLGHLMTVPYLCGLVAGVLGLSIARRSRFPLAAVVVTTAVLALGILFGTSDPASLFLQGATYGAAAIAWASFQRRLNRTAGMQTSRRRSWTGALLSLAIIGGGAFGLGEHLPGVGANERVVLRKHTEPPFDPREHPSPLASYRRYVEPKEKRGFASTELFTIGGVPEGVPIRLATMDSYDGVVFSVGAGTDSSGFFRRVGEDLPDPGPGRRADITVEVTGYAGIWLPDVGRLASIRFTGPRAAELTESFQYNLATDTAVVPIGLRSGDGYEAEIVVPELPGDLEQLRPAATTSEVTVPVLVGKKADEYAGTATNAAGKVAAIVAGIKEKGYFSDGVDAEKTPSRPGHGARRLTEMATPPDPPPVGNGEQYGPLTAIMARSQGVPARVVMGFQPELTSGRVAVTGADVAAWIEYGLDGAGWVPVTDVLPTNDTPPDNPPVTPPPAQSSPPPPPPKLPPSDDSEVTAKTARCTTKSGKGTVAVTTTTVADANGAKTATNCNQKSDRDDDGSTFSVPGWVKVAGGVAVPPVAAIGLVTLTIGALKRRRRTRRRTRGPASTRVASGWDEFTDLACDIGSPVPTRATRSEAAALIASPSARAVATHADAAIFSGAALTDGDVSSYWEQVEGARTELLSSLSRFHRWRALVNLSSLRLSSSRSATTRRLPSLPRRRRTAPPNPRSMATG